MIELIAVGIGVTVISLRGVWAINVRITKYGFREAKWHPSIALRAPVAAHLGGGAAAGK